MEDAVNIIIQFVEFISAVRRSYNREMYSEIIGLILAHRWERG